MARPHPVLRDLAAGRVPADFPRNDDGLLASAVDHGMQGLLWSWVRAHEPTYSARSRLVTLDLATRRRHVRLWETLVIARDRLAAIGVDVVTVKGVTTEARWYGRTGERPCGDVDILVGPEAGRRAAQVLDALAPRHPLLDSIDKLVRSHAMQGVSLSVDGIPVDLHFDVLKLGYPMRSARTLWRFTEDLALPDGSAVRVATAELALVHLIVHANKDSFPRLLGYADVVRVARNDRLDWDVIGRLLRDEGLEEIVARSAATIMRALDLPALPLIDRPSARSTIWRAMWPDRVTLLGSAGTSRSLRQEALPFLVRGRGWDATRAAARVVFPPRAALARRYPDLPGPYVVRLARGRARTMVARHADLRARHIRYAQAPGNDPGGPDGFTKARLLRARIRAKPLWLEVAGRSMGWSIAHGARVRLVAQRNPRRGEVWAYCTPEGALVVHRARGRSAGGHIFQGDASARPDAEVPTELLVGRVTEVAPARGRWQWSAAVGAIQRVPRAVVATIVLGSQPRRAEPTGAAGETSRG